VMLGSRKEVHVQLGYPGTQARIKTVGGIPCWDCRCKHGGRGGPFSLILIPSSPPLRQASRRCPNPAFRPASLRPQIPASRSPRIAEEPNTKRAKKHIHEWPTNKRRPTMRVNEVMTRRAECIPPDATLQEAAERMKQRDVGSLPVCDNNRLVGMLTDRDITVRSVSEGFDPRTDLVREVMTPQVVYCYEDQDVTDAAKLMKEKQIRHLAVLNRQKRLTGIVSLGDLAVEAGNEQLAGETLEGISEPSSPQR